MINRFAFMKPIMILATALLSTALLSGCGTNTMVANAAKAAFEDRLAEEQIVDAKILTTIVENNIDIDKVLALDLSVDVWKTRVMISGALTDKAQRSQVEQAALRDSRISEFYNEIIIVSVDDQVERRAWKEKAQAGANKAAEVIDDFWIETKISAKLIGAEDVSSVNYRWRSVLGTIYIIGEAQNAAELSTTLNIIKSIKGVKAIKNHIVVQGG